MAKSYQIIANTSAEEVKVDLMHLAEVRGETLASSSFEGKTLDSAAQRAADDGDKTNETAPKSEAKSQDIFKTSNVEFSEKTAKKISSADQLSSESASVVTDKKPVVEHEVISAKAVEEKIKTIDQEIFKAIDEEDEKKAPDHEFVAGNPWYDMVRQLPIGVWVELKQDGTDAQLRCKLVANIKTLEKLIFVNKAGIKVAERKMHELAESLKNQEARVINDNMIFDQALESVIVNLRRAQ